MQLKLRTNRIGLITSALRRFGFTSSSSNTRLQMSLLDLPPEVLALIAQHIGPAELRTSTDYIVISRAWYWAVLPIYLSGLQLSTIYVLSNDLERFPRSNTNSPLSQAIRKTVTRLSLCLDGLPSRDALSWDDQREFSKETHQWLDQTIHSHRNGSSKTLQERLRVVVADDKIQPHIRGADDHWWEDLEDDIVYRDRVRNYEIQEAKELDCRLSNWRGRLNDRLSHFAEILSASKELCEFKIETTPTPRWDYIFTPPVGRLLTSLPVNVTTLTLDTHAVHFLTREDGAEPVHICAIISQRLQSFQTVKIRMRSICPCILKTPIDSPSTTSKLKTLVIRLYLPDYMSPSDDIDYRHGPDFHAKSCCPGEKPLYEEMVLAGFQLAEASPSTTALRIAYKVRWTSLILVADCKQGEVLRSNWRDHHDGTLIERPWEDSMDLVSTGDVSPGHLALG